MTDQPLHIGFDASLLATPTPSGVEQTIRRTLELILEHGEGFRFTIYTPPPFGRGSGVGGDSRGTPLTPALSRGQRGDGGTPLTPALSQGQRGDGGTPLTPALSRGERGDGGTPLTPALSQGERGDGGTPLTPALSRGERGDGGTPLTPALSREEREDGGTSLTPALSRGEREDGGTPLTPDLFQGEKGKRPGRLARILWQQAALPGRLRRDGVDALHAPGYVAPLRAPCPTVVTIYDTLAVTRPDLSKRANTLHYGLVMPRSARKAARVIVPTEYVRRQVANRLGVADERIRVIPLPLRDLSRADVSEAKMREVASRYALPERFILYVGNIEPKKNVETLVRAFAAMRREGRVEHKLVLAGRWAWKCRGARDAIREEGIGSEIVETGYARDEDLPALYRMAALFVFPSIEEGYGLPPLEAMAMGTPVVASNAASLPEALGEGALLVPPADARSLRVAMEKALTNAFLRQALIERGKQRIAAMQPADIARQTLDTYREAADTLGKRPSRA